MKILTRYILKEMVGPTALGFVFYTFIILMQRLFDLAGMIIRGSLSGTAVAKLLYYSLPNIFVLTVPMSLLFGILIAVGRLSSDSEIVAMRALGISTRTIYRPVFLFSLAMFVLNLYLINFVLPEGNRQFVALRAELLTSSAEKAIKPRIFHDQFDNLMIYVNDVDPATGQWKGVFVSDTRTETPDPENPQEMADRLARSTEKGDENLDILSEGAGQRVILARGGNLGVVRSSRDVWMNLQDAETHVWDASRPDRYDRTSNESQRILLPTSGGGPVSANTTQTLREMNLTELIDQERALRKSDHEGDRVTRNYARVEIHKKFAIPFACIAFGVLGLPLGITNRRGGKSSGFSLSIGIILFYYLMINNGEQLAGAGRIPPFVGMWAANIILLALGFFLLSRANRDFATGRENVLRRASRGISALLRKKRRQPAATAAEEQPSLLSRLDVTFPNILDRYILREFLKILVPVLVSVVVLFVVVDYNEIAKDVRQNSITARTVLTYYRFFLFSVLNWTLAIAVLVSTLVTFGIMSRNNEITAIKSNGVSLYRIALPIVSIAIVLSVLAYFLYDFVLPYANQRVAQLKNQIEGRTTVSSSAQQKLWYLGKGGRYLVNFLAYDPDAKQLTQVQVFELHPTEFRLTRRVYARHATWNGDGWSFDRGWIRSFRDDGGSTYTPITRPLTLFYRETPEDFATEVREPEEMTFAQLRRYVRSLKASGYTANELEVSLWAKTSWPAISVIMALIAMPFAFRIGKRGALYGIGLALVLGIVYWLIYAVFTKFGEVGNLPPLLSAWSANILFGLAAVYLFLHVET